MDDKSKSLEAVFAKVAHDLRTPLSVVHTTTNMLLNPKYQLTPDQVREQHLRIRRNVEVMNRMIGEIADLAQLHTGTLSIDIKPTDVDEILRAALAANEAAALGKGVTLSYDAGSETMAQGDRTRLLQLFQNLLQHAVNGSDSGGNISVRSQVRDGIAHVEITGSGLEMAEADLPHLFDPWRNGIELGLFIGKGIVEAHGGQIFCSQQPGVGTTFSVTLPVAQFGA